PSTWCRSAVNRSSLFTLAVCRTRSRPWDAPCRLGVQGVPSCSAFSSAPALGSTNSSAGRPAPFARFTATQAESDPSSPCIIGFGSSPSRCGPLTSRAAKVEVSRFPVEELPYMPGSSTTQDRACARDRAHPRFAFRCDNGVGAPIDSFAAVAVGTGISPCTLHVFAAGLIGRLAGRASLPGATFCPLCHEYLGGTRAPAGWPRCKSSGELRLERQYRD